MRHHGIIFSSLICIALNSTLALAEAPTIPISATREIVLDPYQLNIMNKDLPASDILFDGSGNLWVAGKTSLWRWALTGAEHENRLHKIPIASVNQDNPIRVLATYKDQLFAATDKNLYRISFEPTKVVRYDVPAAKSGQTGQISIDEENSTVWWVHQNGIFKMGTDFRLKADVDGNPFKAGDHVWFESNNRQLWLTRGENLFVRDLRLKDSNAKLVHKAQETLTAIQGDETGTYVHTPYTVLRFDQTLRLVQAIPVEGGRKLQSFYINKGTHAYLFDDSLVEIYNTAKESLVKTYPDIGNAKGATRLLLSNDHIAAIVDGMPKVFHYDTKINVAAKPKADDKG